MPMVWLPESTAKSDVTLASPATWSVEVEAGELVPIPTFPEHFATIVDPPTRKIVSLVAQPEPVTVMEPEVTTLSESDPPLNVSTRSIMFCAPAVNGSSSKNITSFI